MINVLVRFQGGPSETETKQYFTILPAHTESANDHTDACAFRKTVESACKEAVQEVRKAHEYSENFCLSAVVAQYQFLT